MQILLDAANDMKEKAEKKLEGLSYAQIKSSLSSNYLKKERKMRR